MNKLNLSCPGLYSRKPECEYGHFMLKKKLFFLVFFTCTVNTNSWTSRSPMPGVQGNDFFLKMFSLSTYFIGNLVVNLAIKKLCLFVLVQDQIVMRNYCYLYAHKLYYELRISRQINCQIRDHPKKRDV